MTSQRTDRRVPGFFKSISTRTTALSRVCTSSAVARDPCYNSYSIIFVCAALRRARTSSKELYGYCRSFMPQLMRAGQPIFMDSSLEAPVRSAGHLHCSAERLWVRLTSLE
jgi:hypothetical protein